MNPNKFEIKVYVIKDFISEGKRIEILALPDFDIKNSPEVLKNKWTLKEIKYDSGEPFIFEDNGGWISTKLKTNGYCCDDATVKFGEK